MFNMLKQGGFTLDDEKSLKYESGARLGSHALASRVSQFCLSLIACYAPLTIHVILKQIT